ncbi:hypothetical protein MMC20_001044 [Loxospora ochrophaea]|nr:hypothetical protein [Loxospora ochrophaea]
MAESKLSGPLDGSFRGVLGSDEFPAERHRYHLYIGRFCPFAHRVMLTRELKELQDFLPISIVRPYPKEDGGWRFPTSDSEYPGSTVDHLFGSKFLHEVYFRSPPAYSEYKGRYSVPVLWDKKTNQVVNHESEDIMRQLNTVFNSFLPENSKVSSLDFYPERLRPEIESISSWLVADLNTGVYKAGFAPDQTSYAKACQTVFAALDRLEAILEHHNGPWILMDSQPTELDLKAYATLIRFDAIYVQHFKLNVGTIRHNYPHLHRYLKHLYWKVEGVKETTNFVHIKENYSKSHTDINPKHITPIGPVPDIEPWTEKDEAWRLTWAT